MADLAQAKATADRSQADFEQACKDHGFVDHWGAYQRDGEWPAELSAKHARMISDLHDFYELRDGPKGFLGGRCA